MFHSDGSQFVILCLSIVFRRSRLGSDPALRPQLVKCWIQRSLAHPQNILRNMLIALGDIPAVSLSGLKSLKYQQIKCSLQQIGFYLFHMPPRHPTRQRVFDVLSDVNMTGGYQELETSQ